MSTLTVPLESIDLLRNVVSGSHLSATFGVNLFGKVIVKSDVRSDASVLRARPTTQQEDRVC